MDIIDGQLPVTPVESCASVSPHKKTGPGASPDKKILRGADDGCGDHVLITMCCYGMLFTRDALFIIPQVRCWCGHLVITKQPMMTISSSRLAWSLPWRRTKDVVGNLL